MMAGQHKREQLDLTANKKLIKRQSGSSKIYLPKFSLKNSYIFKQEKSIVFVNLNMVTLTKDVKNL